METLSWPVVVALLLLLAFTGALAACETVLVRLPLIRALRLAEEGAPRADRLLWLLEHRPRALDTVLVVTVSVRVALAALATTVALAAADSAWAVAVAAVVVIAASLVVGEVVPRSLAMRHLEQAGLRLSGFLRALVRVVGPVARVVVAAGRAVTRGGAGSDGPFGDDEDRDPAPSEDVDDGIEEVERAMIRSIFELGDTLVREIMVPRPDMVTVHADATLRELVNTIVEHGYSRIPVHGMRRDDIVGVVYAKDVLRRLAMRPGAEHWDDLIRDPVFVPETKRVDDLLRGLQESTVHLAIVADEYGEVVGLVTIEDILEEIVGEIVDEHDREEPLVAIVDDGHYRVDARLPVDDLNELFGTQLPEEGWDTVGGLVIGTLGHVPTIGESLDIDGLTLRAERVQGRRVSKVLVMRRAEPDGDEDHTGQDR